MQRLNQPQSQSIIKLSASICQQHNLPFQTYCSHENCSNKIRVCPKCKGDHSNHQQKYFTQGKQVVDDLTIGLKRCFDKIAEFDQRSNQLTKLMKVVQYRCKQEYQEMEKSLVERMKEDKKNIQKKMIKLEQIHSKIQQKQRTKTYFAKMHQSNLLLLKIKLSNQKGMLQLKQKNQKLCESMSKSNYEQIKNCYEEFFILKTQLESELQNNFTFKIGQIIALKNSQKQLNRNAANINKENKEKENYEPRTQRKQKPKPKTTLNFGEGIITGILNFLNF